METILKEGLTQLGLDTGSIPALTEFSRRLLEKNQVMNLTAITEPADVARLHLLDCACLLTAADFRGKQVVDGLLENAAEQLTPEMAVFTEEEKQEFLACAGTFRRLLSKLESGGRAK